MKLKLNYLLVLSPITLILYYLHAVSDITLFILSAISIIPIAGLLGEATEAIAEKMGEGIGGLLNATFGNAAELIIAIIALKNGYHEIVKASITGSIIGNILLVMGLSFLLGGIKHPIQKFNKIAVRSQTLMLTVASFSLILPAAFHSLVPQEAWVVEKKLSLIIASILFLTYILGLIFSLKTHKHLFSGEETSWDIPADTQKEIAETTDNNLEKISDTAEQHNGHWSIRKSVTILIISTIFIALISEILVHSVHNAASSLGMSELFVGIIIVAIVGNAAEHSTAITVALKNRMDLSISIGIGSSIQIALFVAPTLLFLSYLIGPQPLDLVFTSSEVLAVSLSVFIVSQVADDGKSNWIEGIQLLAMYAILATIFFFLPG